MRKIFSSLLLVFVIPISILKKTKIDNFIGGLFIGAIFSLLVNIVTNQIGEQIARQKSLEALEIELLNQHITGINTINNYTKGAYKKSQVYTYTSYRYNDNIWKSLASTTFFYSLSPDVQGKLTAYYHAVIEPANNALADNDQIVHTYLSNWVGCAALNGNCVKEQLQLNAIEEYYTQQQVNWANSSEKFEYEVQDIFHPTRDRLKDPILSFLMGKQALGALAVPWKPAAK